VLLLQNEKQSEDADTCHATAEEFDNSCDPVNLPSPSYISAEASNLHSIVLDSMHDIEQPCSLESTLTEEAVECVDNRELLRTAVYIDDHGYCPAVVCTEHPSRTSKHTVVRSKRTQSRNEDICRPKRVKLQAVTT
jgi:hypothetical protein